jgi:hypothetical protein
MVSVDRSGHVDRYDDGVYKAVWSGALPAASGRHPNQPARYVPFPKDRATAAKYLKRFDLSIRAQEPLGPHRLGADPDQVHSVFVDLEARMRSHNITKLRQVLVTDEFRLKKEMELVIAAIQCVCASTENRTFMSSLQRVVEGATVVPVSSVLGETHVIQVVCRDADRRTPAEDVRQLFRVAGFTCPMLVCYSDSGYQTGETNKLLKEALIETLGSNWAYWMPGQPLPEHYILIEDGASMHSASDIAHSLFCLTSGLVVHHVAPNSTHFSQLYDRIVFLIAKLLSIKELSLRIQAMTSQRPENAISRAGWCHRVMANCVITMNAFDINNSSLQEQRNHFMSGFMSGREAEVAAMDRKLDEIFDAATRARNRCDELFLLSAIAPSMFIALQPKYVVKSAMMVGLLPPNFELGRDDDMLPGVWPDAVMQNQLVQLQIKRRENERNFVQNHEISIRETLSAIGMEADQQILSSAPPLSSAGEKAALDAAGDIHWNTFKRSRGLDRLPIKYQALCGDFHMFKQQVQREESRTSALTGLRGFNSRTEATCSALLQKQENEHIIASIAATERGIRIGTSKFNVVVERADAAARHLNLWRRSGTQSKQFHARNFCSSCSTGQSEYDAGCVNYNQVDQVLANLKGFDDISETTIADLRSDFYDLHNLKAHATACKSRIGNLQFIHNAELSELGSEMLGAAPQLEVEHGELGRDNAADSANSDASPNAALDDAPVAAVEAVARRRQCRKCLGFGHQANSRHCPLNQQSDTA